MADDQPAGYPSAESLLAWLEAQNTMADMLDGLRANLVERGWDSLQAQAAARELMIPVLVATLTNDIQRGAK